MMRRIKPAGFTLLEVIAALIIGATIAAVGISYLQTPGQAAHQRSCDMTREMLQSHAQRHNHETGRWPSANLRELATAEYAGSVLPRCPVTGEAYTLRRNVVQCPTHEATR